MHIHHPMGMKQNMSLGNFASFQQESIISLCIQIIHYKKSSLQKRLETYTVLRVNI